MNETQQANNANKCPKCGGTHFGDMAGNCPLSPDYIPSKPWPKASEVLSRIPKRIARTVFCEKHQRYYQEGSSCFDCFMAETHQDILRAILLNHEFVPAVSGCSCHWIAEFGGSSNAYEKWVDHVTDIMKRAQPA